MFVTFALILAAAILGYWFGAGFNRSVDQPAQVLVKPMRAPYHISFKVMGGIEEQERTASVPAPTQEQEGPDPEPQDALLPFPPVNVEVETGSEADGDAAAVQQETVAEAEVEVEAEAGLGGPIKIEIERTQALEPEFVAERSVERPSVSDKQGPGEVRIIRYRVREGDTLLGIAYGLGVDYNTIVGNNEIANVSLLYPGQILVIPNQRGVLHQVKRDQTLSDISYTYSVPIGKIIKANDIKDQDLIYPNQELFIPDADLSPRVNALRLSKGKLTTFVWPVLGLINSPYGWRPNPVTEQRQFHEGIDIAGDKGDRIYAARAGRVVYADFKGGYGKLVTIDHRDRLVSRYAHLSSILVYPGQFIEQGQLIGLMGSTGFSTGNHLHFEIRRRGNSVDPRRYLP
ncbi:MAG: peptidoglycan DD-metalloendopeptidase family protein [Candidatus Bipolaricaulia bacterium]